MYRQTLEIERCFIEPFSIYERKRFNFKGLKEFSSYEKKDIHQLRIILQLLKQSKLFHSSSVTLKKRCNLGVFLCENLNDIPVKKLTESYSPIPHPSTLYKCKDNFLA
jgi:hypothetical protein